MPSLSTLSKMLSEKNPVQSPMQDLNEFVGKVITRFVLADDETLGRQVVIHFDDGTHVSIAYRPVVVREAQHVGENGETIRRYPDPPAKEWSEFKDTGVED